ncbi:hypothetical protein BESB_038270 [Besnoitia besnoiti]|uniref:RIIa domain-containing protein n=1 Tax=Besnoitia besnoiti TaxID=94643 RepID=A0A2A9MHK3_BESBE|nr:hypothetical protein BESB_038270 [Besnoitia besnoiti]PFH37369.1 hypothetical protein BESB_038270 [Besnoitia besnoiti]
MPDGSRRSSGSSCCSSAGSWVPVHGEKEVSSGASRSSADAAESKVFARQEIASEGDVLLDDCDSIPVEGATKLTEEQQLQQRRNQVALMIENEKYLQHHAELAEMLALFMTKVLEERPQNVLKFAGEFFTQNGLKELVQSQLDEEGVYCNLAKKLEEAGTK